MAKGKSKLSSKLSSGFDRVIFSASIILIGIGIVDILPKGIGGITAIIAGVSLFVFKNDVKNYIRKVV